MVSKMENNNHNNRTSNNSKSSNNNLCCHEIRRFGELTSIKGVGRSIKAEFRGLRYMWACAVVAFFGVTVFNVYTLTDEFLGKVFW